MAAFHGQQSSGPCLSTRGQNRAVRFASGSNEIRRLMPAACVVLFMGAASHLEGRPAWFAVDGLQPHRVHVPGRSVIWIGVGLRSTRGIIGGKTSGSSSVTSRLFALLAGRG